jgi:hypothetical protein
MDGQGKNDSEFTTCDNKFHLLPLGYFIGFLICEYTHNQRTGFEPTINDLMRMFEETEAKPQTPNTKEKE